MGLADVEFQSCGGVVSQLCTLGFPGLFSLGCVRTEHRKNDVSGGCGIRMSLLCAVDIHPIYRIVGDGRAVVAGLSVAFGRWCFKPLPPLSLFRVRLVLVLDCLSSPFLSTFAFFGGNLLRRFVFRPPLVPKVGDKYASRAHRWSALSSRLVGRETDVNA